jgi:osmotically-inducible protein OsmY
VPLTPSSGVGDARPTSTSPALDPVLDKTETSDDRDSAREIRARLAADKSLSATARQVTINVDHGRVRLRGQVNTAEERAAVERAARKAVNVIDVRNELVVLQ